MHCFLYWFHLMLIFLTFIMQSNASVAFFKVLAIGVTLFSEVASVLQHMKNQFPEVAINCGAFFPVKELSQLEEMLIKEKAEFVVNPTAFFFLSINLEIVTVMNLLLVSGNHYFTGCLSTSSSRIL